MARESEAEAVGLDDIILAALERGLTMSDIRQMQLGQIVDFCAAYNERQRRAEREIENNDKPVKMKATQAQIDAFFG